MQILDSTLREGEQQYGVFFDIATKLRLVKSISEVADFIEIPPPAIAPSYKQAAEEISNLVQAEQLLVHVGLDTSGLYSARDLGANWVGLYVAIRKDIHEVRYGRKQNETLMLLADRIRLSKRLGLRVRVTCEDASRTPVDELVEFYRAALTSGAERVGFADTTGILVPDSAVSYLCALEHAGIPLSKLHVHFHDDRGYAIENASIAARLGVACVDGSINGIGERLGITRLQHLLSLQGAKHSGATDDAEQIVSQRVVPLPALRRRFAHKAGIHIDGVLKCSSIYEWTNPETLGAERVFVLSKLSGHSGLEYYLRQIPAEIRALYPSAGEILQVLKRQDSLEIDSRGSFEDFLTTCFS